MGYNMFLFNDFKSNQYQKLDIICIIRSIEEKDSKGGKYLSFVLFDGITEVTAKMWKTTKGEVDVDKNDVVKATIDASIYNSNLNYIVSKIEKSQEKNVEDFIVSAPIKADVMFDYIMSVIDGFENDTLKYISNKIYTDYKDKILIWPAAKRMHHDIRSGLLYHTYRMLKVGEGIVNNTYDQINKEMVLAGIILHDVGKLFEMSPTETGNGEYTLDGELFGHLYLGMRLIANVANTKDIKLNQNDVKHLIHIIGSHHGKYEYGAIALPKTKEAYIVSEIDMMDSRYYMYEKAENEMSDGEHNNEFVKL